MSYLCKVKMSYSEKKEEREDSTKLKKDKLITMSKKELTRLEVIQKIGEKRIKQKEAAEMLGISERHIRRLVRAYREHGEEGLVSKRRGKRSNHQMSAEKKEKVIKLLHRRYHDFGPTLAREKIGEIDGIRISVESVRKIMMEEGLWRQRRKKHKRIHPIRQRRARIGELVQIDGSYHAWFEERAPKCNLLVYIDDASGRIMELLFTPTETTFSYLRATRQYLAEYGKPIAFYSDRHSIFKINIKNALTGTGMTQYGRAMKQLDIEVICAYSPQAKGRVERANETLQDRLVKELRLRGISDIGTANAFMAEYIQDYNRRFAVIPRCERDAHRPVEYTEEELDHIFSLQERRTLSKNLTLQYKKVVYQIQTSRPVYAMRNAQVTVCENEQGDIRILYKGKALAYTVFHKQEKQGEVVSGKEVDGYFENKKPPKKPAQNHPWRRYGQRVSGKPIMEVK